MEEQVTQEVNQETTGVEVPAEAAQEEKQQEQVTTKTGEEGAEAGPEVTEQKSKEEIAWAKRIAAEREKWEKQYSPYKDFIETEAARHNMTPDQYLQAVEQSRQEQERQELLDKGIDPDALYGALDKHPVMQQAKQVLLEKQMADFKDKPFFNELQPQISQLLQDIPGMDVKTAYSYKLGEMLMSGGLDTLTAEYKEKIAQLEQGIQVKDNNSENAAKSTGSVTGQGNPPPEFFSREQVEKMSQADIERNLDKIQESMKHW